MSKPWPEIVVLPKVFSKGRLAQYRDHASPRRIELSAALSMADMKTRKYVVYHEIGHYFRVEHAPGIARERGWGGEERFAHEFASFFLLPAALKRTEPDAHARMSVLIDGSSRKQIKSFAGKVLRTVARS